MTGAASSAPALVGQLSEVWDSIYALCRELTADEWATSTACPGWDIADQVAHLVGTESMLAGRPGPPAEEAAPDPEHVRNDIGRINEQWVRWLRRSAPREVLEGFRELTSARLEQLRGRAEADWDEPSWTPVGPSTYRRFMQIRVFDCWVHEQDMRAALRRPGHDQGPAVEQAIDEIERALGFIVGKKAGAPAGARVTIELTGPLRRSIHLVVDGRAAVVESLDRDPDVMLRMGSPTFAALACGRVDPAGAQVTVEGDQALGQRIVEQLAFTI